MRRMGRGRESLQAVEQQEEVLRLQEPGVLSLVQRGRVG